MNPNTSLFLGVNDFARATPGLHGPLALYVVDGLVVFAGLLLAGWWIARRDGDPIRMAALWAPLGTLLLVERVRDTRLRRLLVAAPGGSRS